MTIVPVGKRTSPLYPDWTEATFLNPSTTFEVETQTTFPVGPRTPPDPPVAPVTVLDHDLSTGFTTSTFDPEFGIMATLPFGDRTAPENPTGDRTTEKSVVFWLKNRIPGPVKGA
jgi:hypothetical protein